jgi:hypothetical protein
MGKTSREIVSGFLQERDGAGLSRWAQENRGAVRILLSHLVSDDPILPERAAEALGLIAADLAKTNPEKVREIIRRLLWSMNDEAGSLIIHAPQALAEILANVPELIGEYADLLFSFWDESPFQGGIIQAAARLSAVKPEALAGYLPHLNAALDSPDPITRKYAAQALANLKEGGF